MLQRLICSGIISRSIRSKLPPITTLSETLRTITLKPPSMSANKGKSAGSHSVSSDSDSDDAHKNKKSDSDSKQKKTEPMRYATRGKILSEQEKNVEKAKERILSLDINEKRKLYKCKKRYTELDSIPTWPDHFSEVLANDSVAQNWWKRNKSKVVSDVNLDLNAKISVFRGDITTLEIDAIVNAANESLLGGGGVDGAIHSAAGMDLLHECELLRGCSPGDAKITCGYKLPAKHVIHTVGPRGEKPEVLQNCYQKSLDLMKDNELTSVAFPCISTGIFGYPNVNAATVALKTIRNWLDTEEYANKVERIIFCLFLEKDVNIYDEQLQLFFPLERGESK